MNINQLTDRAIENSKNSGKHTSHEVRGIVDNLTDAEIVSAVSSIGNKRAESKVNAYREGRATIEGSNGLAAHLMACIDGEIMQRKIMGTL